MIYCSKCGKGIPDDSKFCTFCGAAIPVIGSPKSSQLLRAGPYRISDHRGDFIRSAGFWGSLFVITGFFMPWLQDLNNQAGISGLNIVMSPGGAGLLLLILPICALFILVDSMTNFLPSVAAIFFKCLPFLVLLFIIVRLIGGHKLKGTGDFGFNLNDMQNAIKYFRIGLWATLAGAVIMLFHTKYKRVLVTPLP